MTELTYAQTFKIAKLVQEYAPASYSTENESEDELVLWFKNEKGEAFRRIVLNHKGQVIHIRMT